MFFVYFALWVILNGRWTLEIGAFGLVFAALLYAFTCKFLGYSVKKDLRLIRGVPAAVRYGALLLREIVLANIAVMRIILNPGYEPRPKLVRFESGLKGEAHRVALADSITLTPGTITCQLRGDEYVVHCLDESLADGLTDGALITALRDMETEKPAKKPDEKPADERSEEPAAKPDEESVDEWNKETVAQPDEEPVEAAQAEEEEHES